MAGQQARLVASAEARARPAGGRRGRAATPAGDLLGPADVSRLQHTIGNQAVTRLLAGAGSPIQRQNLQQAGWMKDLGLVRGGTRKLVGDPRTVYIFADPQPWGAPSKVGALQKAAERNAQVGKFVDAKAA